jgi:hypothetical protein
MRHPAIKAVKKSQMRTGQVCMSSFVHEVQQAR